MPLYNASGTIGQIINGFTTDVTGSIFITILLLFIGIVLVALIFRLSLTVTIFMLTPFLIVWVAYDTTALKILFGALIFLAVILGLIFFRK